MGANLDHRLHSGEKVNALRRLAEANAWLQSMEARKKPDWAGVLAQLRTMLHEISASAAIRYDLAAQDILQAMILAQDIEGLDQLLDALGHRVAEMVAERSGDPMQPMRGGRRALASLFGIPRPVAAQDGAAEKPSRIFLRL